jgi:pullulanase
VGLVTGPSGVPGVIIMSVIDGEEGKPGLPQMDPTYHRVVVVLNARATELVAEVESMKSSNLSLHPVQSASHDEIVKNSKFASETGTFTIPARTTAVFVEKR